MVLLGDGLKVKQCRYGNMFERILKHFDTYTINGLRKASWLLNIDVKVISILKLTIWL